MHTIVGVMLLHQRLLTFQKLITYVIEQSKNIRSDHMAMKDSGVI